MKPLILYLEILCLGIMAVGCDQNKMVETKYQTCQNRKIENQWIVHWKGNRSSLVQSKLRVHGAFVGNKDTPEIEFVEPNYRILQSEAPLRFNNLADSVMPSPTEIRKSIGVPAAWNQGYRGQGVIIAVVDSGIDLGHSSLRRNLHINTEESQTSLDSLDNDQNGFVDDFYGWNFTNNSGSIRDEIGHGTAMAGIIVGQEDQALGIAPEARILPVDFMDEQGGTEFHAKKAIDYGISRGAKIVNNSWSISCSQLLQNSFLKWSQLDVIFVNASGNTSQNVVTDGVIPSSMDSPNFLNVGASDLTGHRSQFSSYGDSVKIFAPGEFIPTITPSWYPEKRMSSSGTSASTAILSGAAAILWSAYPQASAQKIVDLIYRGADRTSGIPILNLEKSLSLTSNLNTDVPPRRPYGH